MWNSHRYQHVFHTTVLANRGGKLTKNQYFTDWREYGTNLRPIGWTFPHDQPKNTAIRVAGNSTVSSGRVLEWNDPGGSRDRYSMVYSGWSAYDGSANSQKQEVYGEFEVVSPTYTNDGVHAFLCGLMTRVSGTGATEKGFRLVLHETIADHVKHLTLNAYDNNAYTELVSVPFSWTNGVVYEMRLRDEGTRIIGNVWIKGEPEPTTPLIDYTITNSTYIAYTGPPGLQFHEASIVRCYKWSAGLAGDTAPVSYAKSPVSTKKQYFYNFSNDTVGNLPTGFSNAFANHSGRFKVVKDPTDLSRNVLEFTGQVGARSMYGLFIDDIGTVGDIELYAEIYVPASSVVPSVRMGGLIARGGVNGTLWTGWGNDSRSDTSGNFFAASNYDRWVNSSAATTIAGDSGFTTTAGLVKDTWTSLRIKIERNVFYARYWQSGTAEPSTWFRSTDAVNLVPTSTTAQGKVGVYTQEDRTMRWRCVGVGIDGYSAPTS